MMTALTAGSVVAGKYVSEPRRDLGVGKGLPKEMVEVKPPE